MSKSVKDFKFIPAILTSFDVFLDFDSNDFKKNGFDVGAAEFIKAILEK